MWISKSPQFFFGICNQQKGFYVVTPRPKMFTFQLDLFSVALVAGPYHHVARHLVVARPPAVLQDRNVLKRAVVQCFKRPLVFHEASLSGVSQNWRPLKSGFPTPLKIN